MLEIMALRAPVSPVQHGRVPRKGRLGAAGSPSRCRCSSLRAPVSPRVTVVSPGRAAASQRVAFALQVLLGYLLLLAPRRPRL